MGDRSNVILRQKGEQVVFYAHWGGPELFEAARDAIKLQERWDDYQYLTAIVFRQIIKRFDPKLEGTTGIGISGMLGDNEYPILILDVDKEEAFFEDEHSGEPLGKAISFDEFQKRNPPGLKNDRTQTEPMKQEFLDELVGLTVAKAQKEVVEMGFEYSVIPTGTPIAGVAMPSFVWLEEKDGKVVAAFAGDRTELV